jgi:hypothetical protein
MTHEPGSPHARLREYADHAWRLYCALETEIPYRKSAGSGQEKIRQHRVVAPVPWNSVAAELTLEFHSEIRRLEVHLKERVIGGYPRRRGSSGANTRRAIDSVVDLCTTTDQETIHGILGFLMKWSSRAETVFTPENGLHRLPRQPGEKEARCPYCEHTTMRWNPHNGRAVCVNPACRNHSGQRPHWTAEFTPTRHGLIFRWDEQEAA